MIYYAMQFIRRALARYATRHYRRTCLHWGRRSRILQGFTRITDPSQTTVGEDVRIMDGGFFQTDGGLEIGSNTVVSRNVTILTATHDYRSGIPFHPTRYIVRPVRIGRDCWIGQGVTILPGTALGMRCIVQAGAVVRGNWPPRSMIFAAVSELTTKIKPTEAPNA